MVNFFKNVQILTFKAFLTLIWNFFGDIFACFLSFFGQNLLKFDIKERLILNRIGTIEEEMKVDLTGESQHGFKKGKSTSTASLSVQQH